ncbi:MAG: hypothetical protein FIA97_20005 [Methylococcaceae bacterium]|nr:hypothetical protein [Methylococcaceae bacterium]
MDLEAALGLGSEGKQDDDVCGLRRRHLMINLFLAASGQPVCDSVDSGRFLSTTRDLLAAYREKSRLLSEYLCPADQRIQAFLDRYLGDVCDGEGVPRLPGDTLVLHRHGLARELSLPPDRAAHESKYLKSYRVTQGILHNPLNDRRTTEGSFHIAEGGLPIPGDKKAVPRPVFARLLRSALNPPRELLALPFTAGQAEQAELFVCLLLRPVVCPEVPGFISQKSMEVRVFAPGSLVSNLDFLESIFGNAGNPQLPEHDAGLDVEHWTGHSGCIILAPHLVDLTKKELGLLHVTAATPRQIAEGMCWSDESERYNGGNPFKLTARDASGVIVSLLADNYYGYGKKEVKTQISFSANLYGLAEEEHAGGALTFARHSHGEEFGADTRFHETDHSLAEARELFAEMMEPQPEGHAVDRRYPRLIYVPKHVQIDLPARQVSWEKDGRKFAIPLDHDKVYMHPTGYKVTLEKHLGGPTWRLVGTDPEGVFCHKPCTVSGGGKSEISKSIENTILFGPIFVADLEEDLDQVEHILAGDYADRLKQELRTPGHVSRPVLSPKRSLGSVIKLLTPSETYSADYNAWVESIPNRIKSLVYLIKRFYRPEWGSDWRSRFSVDFINGCPAHELKLDNRILVASNLRVGFEPNGSWRVFKLRQDFISAEKLQMEDDITASILVPSEALSYLNRPLERPSVKLTHNCEYRFFQRPDAAIHRGLDKQAELDLSKPGNFLSNFEPLDRQALAAEVHDVMEMERYSRPMANFLRQAQNLGGEYTVSSARPRLVNGKPSKNPRYLQLRADLEDGFKNYVAEMGMRLYRKLPPDRPLCFPVDAVLSGRRNNPANPAKGIRALAVYSPLHYQELPELFMDYICSLSGKSPSTTGAGSEGALTKGPFNAVRSVVDLNNALVGFIVSGYGGFSTPAGHIGTKGRIDHDISLLIPEIWARLPVRTRDPRYLIAEGHLEAVADYQYQGRTILASRLGYRITRHFVHSFLGRIFDSPAAVFDEELLKPEVQDPEAFAEGIEHIVENQRKVALQYLEDGSVDDACPPLKALLHIMADGAYQGRDLHHPEIRGLFDRAAVMESEWYRQRLVTRQRREQVLWQRHCAYLEGYLNSHRNSVAATELGLSQRLEQARVRLAEVNRPDYWQSLRGTIGADPSL